MFDGWGGSGRGWCLLEQTACALKLIDSHMHHTVPLRRCLEHIVVILPLPQAASVAVCWLHLCAEDSVVSIEHVPINSRIRWRHAGMAHKVSMS